MSSNRKITEKNLLGALQKAQATQPCARCSGDKFKIVGKSFIFTGDPNDLANGSEYISCHILVCSQCGVVTMHADAILWQYIEGS